jgi:hypothetical protein
MIFDGFRSVGCRSAAVLFQRGSCQIFKGVAVSGLDGYRLLGLFGFDTFGVRRNDFYESIGFA